MLPKFSLTTVSLLTTLALYLQPTAADACGGCFTPPRAPSSVLGHRMVLSVSPTQTTLWDQFNYSGNPSEFAWILPIQNGPAVRVALADDRFPAALQQMTPIGLALPPPPPRCPYCPPQCHFSPPADVPFAAFDAANAQDAPSVIVHRQDIVGPYAIAVVGSANADDLRNWLTNNGYSVPASINPVIDAYVAQHSDFVALKLRAGASVNQMAPIRVTTPGYAPTLPLRMVAAGVTDVVGLDLYVIAASRFEAMNFPNAHLSNDDFTFDYATQTWPPNTFSDLQNAMRSARQGNGGRTWLTEVVNSQELNFFRSVVRSNAAVFAPQPPVCGAPDAGMEIDAAINGSCREPSYQDDIDVALEGQRGNVWLTHLSAQLPAAMLDRDLQLAASASNVEVSGQLEYGRQLHYPPAPVCEPCVDPCRDGGRNGLDVTQGSRPDAGLDGGTNGGPVAAHGGCAASCSVGTTQHKNNITLWFTIAAAVTSVIGRRKKGV